MGTSQSSTEQISIIRIDINGEKHLLELSHSISAAKLRAILVERYKISSNTHFRDTEGYTLFPGDEQKVTISQLLTENNVIKIVTDKTESTPIPISERKNKACEKKRDLKYVQTLSQSTKTASRELKLPGSTLKCAENKIVIATDVDLDMWEKIFRNCNLFYGIRMDKETPIRAFKSVLQFKKTIDCFEFHVTDESNIRAYMKDKVMHSSFLPSQFFDGDIKISCPFIGIGINAVYSKSKATTNTQKKTYLTYCYNFPRVTLQLDLSYLEPTTEFIEAIDNVLKTLTPYEQVIALEKVLSTYGHVYPRSVVLGGHLYHTEEYDNKEKAEEAKTRISAVSYFAALFKLAEIHLRGRSEQKSQSKSSEQDSLWITKAVGGDTRFNHDSTLWKNTIGDPSFWRIIEQDDYQSVITLLDQERQQNLRKIFDYDDPKKKTLRSSL